MSPPENFADDEPRRRYADGYDAAGRALFTGRWGRWGDALARTFGATPTAVHRDAAPRKKSKSATPGNNDLTARGRGIGRAIDYIARCGDYSSRDDLVAVGGCAPEEMKHWVEKCCAGTIRKDGVVIETVILELPIQLSPSAWQRIAESAARLIENTGRPAVWAVHAPEKKRGRDPEKDRGIETNPHAHLAFLARQVVGDRVLASGGPGGRRAEGATLWGRETWRDKSVDAATTFHGWKRAVADIINRELDAAGVGYRVYWGKALDLGITDEPERRIPLGAWADKTPPLPPALKPSVREHPLAEIVAEIWRDHSPRIPGIRARDPERVKACHAQHEAERQERATKKKARADRREARIRAAGYVPASDVRDAENRASLIEAQVQCATESATRMRAIADQAITDRTRAEALFADELARIRAVDTSKKRASEKAETAARDLIRRKLGLDVGDEIEGDSSGVAGSLVRVLSTLPDAPTPASHASGIHGSGPTTSQLVLVGKLLAETADPRDPESVASSLVSRDNANQLIQHLLAHKRTQEARTAAPAMQPEPIRAPLDRPLAVIPRGRRASDYPGVPAGWTCMEASRAAEVLGRLSQSELDGLQRVTHAEYLRGGHRIGTDSGDCITGALDLLRTELARRPAELPKPTQPTLPSLTATSPSQNRGSSPGIRKGHER